MRLTGKLILISFLALGGHGASLAQPAQDSLSTHNYVPPDGVVPNAKVASRIAEIVLMEVYGEQQIRRQLPFSVSLSGGVWTIRGQLRGKPFTKGGVAEIEISKVDGRVRRLSHGV